MDQLISPANSLEQDSHASNKKVFAETPILYLHTQTNNQFVYETEAQSNTPPTHTHTHKEDP